MQTPKAKAAHKKYHQKYQQRPEVKATRKERYQQNPKSMLRGAKDRAKRLGLAFNIELDDIVIPQICPVLGIPLVFSESVSDNTPSLDRIENQNGYVKGNVAVISLRANTLKSDMTLTELKHLLRYMSR